MQSLGFAALLLFALIKKATSGDVCKEEWCTSPDGKGGQDCWAGPAAKVGEGQPEPCSCSQGTAELTGDRIRLYETWYYRYTCCVKTSQTFSKNANQDKGECGDNTCSEDYCDKSKQGQPCWISKSEKCACSRGRPKIVDGAEAVYDGNTYYKYTCCTGDAPEISDSEYCAADGSSSASSSSNRHKDKGGDLSCSGQYCTSPGANGGHDCWAGSEHEPCTCSKGAAMETGNSGEYEGRTYYEYTCCTGGNEDDYDGEECGDFEGGGGLGVVLIILLLGCACGCCISGIVYLCFKKRVVLTDRSLDSQQPPIAAGQIVELTQTGTAPQRPQAQMEKGNYSMLPTTSVH